MSFLAPWALAVGGLTAVGAVLLHLVAQQRPAAYLLPTARFIPDRRTLVRRIATRPRDLLLLALRVLLLLSAAAAFARPVLTARRGTRARIVLLDRSAAVASGADAVARARTFLADGGPSRLILFDTAATLVPDAAAALDSLARTPPPSAPGSLSAALIAARRAAAPVAAEADSVELVLVSPVTAAELDVAFDSVRAQWPGAITVARIAASADSAGGWSLERPLPMDDGLAPALSPVRVAGTARAVRLRRVSLDARDSAFARAGGTVVHWDTTGAARPSANAIAMGDDVVVAALGRGRALEGGQVIARWADGSPAAKQQTIGEGCVRHVAVAVPIAGDLPLRPGFQRLVRGLMSPCRTATSSALAADTALARLRGQGLAARGAAVAGDTQRPAPLVPWLLGVALLCA
ncbi:MAG: BatA domain-containing protein, partial [Gemmatimonadota bacterium]|nr:BatA domain-containing protein [Gemmatimonadota bacterium]